MHKKNIATNTNRITDPGNNEFVTNVCLFYCFNMSPYPSPTCSGVKHI